MSTDELFAIFANKKLLPFEMMKTYIFDYLKGVSEATLGLIYRSDGVIDVVTPVTGTAVGEVSVAGAFEATDGAGKKFEFGVDDPRLADVPFQNTPGVVYNIGLREIDLVDELDINPRTGQPEYRRQQESIGTLGTPDVVTDNGADITLRVDSVTESGVSHAGRTVRVYLVTPEAVAWANAYEDLVVSWTGSNNEVTTSGLLGQTVGLVSEVEADYVVAEIGPVLVRVATEDLKGAAATVFLATFAGIAGPSMPAPDMTDQNVLSGSLSDLADITRTDTHGDLKVNVRADASDVNEDQVRVEGSGGAKMWAVDEAGGHYLPNSADYIPLDDAGPYGAAGKVFNGDSIMGYINQELVTRSANMGPTVLDGLDLAGSGSNTVDLDPGSAFGAAPGGGGFVNMAATSGLAVTDGVRFLFIDPDLTTVQVTSTKSDAYGDGKIPLWIVVFSGGSLVAQVDLRFFSTNIDKRGVVTVGGDTSNANFGSLEAALWYVNEFQDQTESKYPGVTIRVLEDIDVGSAAIEIGPNLDGLTIEGVSWRGSSGARTKIRYDASVMGSDNAMFLMEGSNIRFVGIEFVTVDGPGTGTDTACVRQNPSGIASPGLTFEGCKFTSDDSTLAFALRGHTNENWDDVTFTDCVFDIGGTDPTVTAITDYGGDRWLFTRCKIVGDASQFVLASEDETLTNAVFDECDFSGLLGTNLASGAANPTSVVAFKNCTGSLGVVPNGVLTDCVFTDTRFNEASASDLIMVSGCVLSGVDMIEKDFSASEFKFFNSIFRVDTGTFFIGGSNPDQIVVSGCKAIEGAGELTVGIAITLNDDCKLVDSDIGPFGSSTFTNIPLIRLNGTRSQISGCNIDGDFYQRGIDFHSGSLYNRVIGNYLTVPGNASQAVIGIYLAGAFQTVNDNNIKTVGTGILTGLGIHVLGNRHTIVGNRIGSIEGAAIYLAAGANTVVVSGNSINDTGSSTSNPWLGMVSNDGIEVFGDNCVISNNVLSTHVDEGIVVESGAVDNCINGNVILSTGGTNGINIKAGAVNTVCQLNNTDNGVADAGTTSLVAGGGNI